MKWPTLSTGMLILFYLLIVQPAPAQVNPPQPPTPPGAPTPPTPPGEASKSEKHLRLEELIRQLEEEMSKDTTNGLTLTIMLNGIAIDPYSLSRDKKGGIPLTEENIEKLEVILRKLDKKQSRRDSDLEDAFDDLEEGEEDSGLQLRLERDSTRNKITLDLGVGSRQQAKRHETYFTFNFGPTDAFGEAKREGIAAPTFRPWRSWSGNIGLLVSSRLGGPQTRVYLNYGVLWKLTYLETKDDLRLNLVNGHPEYTPPGTGTNGTLNKSQLSRQSLVLPLQLRFAGPRDESLNVTVGAYGGIRLYAFQDLRFKTEIGEEARLRLRDDYRTQMWHYGATASIGQQWWQLFADYELSNLFRDNPNYDYRLFNTGVQFMF